MTEQEINAEIHALEARAELLRRQKSKLKYKIVQFEDIDWQGVYDHVIKNFIMYRNDPSDLDEDDPQYLYEYILETICPNIFK